VYPRGEKTKAGNKFVQVEKIHPRDNKKNIDQPQRDVEKYRDRPRKIESRRSQQQKIGVENRAGKGLIVQRQKVGDIGKDYECRYHQHPIGMKKALYR
jgi:hypothetical protein